MINRLSELRKLKGLTQERLAVLSGVHRVTIARYETGRMNPNVKTLEKLSTALQVPIGDLIEQKAG